MANNEQYIHKLRFDPALVAKGSTVLEQWPNLAVHETLVRHGFGENDPFLRFAIYLGEGSGLHTAVPEWAERKREAARLAGIPADHPRYEAALSLLDEGVQELRWTWLRAFSSMELAAYTALREAFYQNCMKVEEPILDGIASLPEIHIDLHIDGKEKAKEAQERADYMLESIAGLIAGKKSELKEDGIQRAYKLRTELGMELAPLILEIKKLEATLFHDDEAMKQQAIEAAKPQAARNSWEEKVLKRNK